ncbi:antitoxin Xre/MbcA/ParS toxin-binding domain-containing protein [Phaeocystidibacter luteus]|uniref:DUF2384 domain-containing protein n=1 Tax=Phaeocystidibacter luteus TaxID=911197 RepID=A0A6N6RKH7_9FLAO|nr:antitoxin Xre/MbcA/ParS toxin-binding domain-containing protein [Phaeocystidibacter luteus]KAB2810165.1 DUF2384 domain-containing protein [Phaeocystidibacter luteus]
MSAKSLRHIESDAVGKTNPVESERIMELAEVSFYGIEVFGTKAKFYVWVKSPSVDLNGKRPLDILSCSYGKELVIDLIGRIEHGIFA